MQRLHKSVISVFPFFCVLNISKLPACSLHPVTLQSCHPNAEMGLSFAARWHSRFQTGHRLSLFDLACRSKPDCKSPSSDSQWLSSVPYSKRKFAPTCQSCFSTARIICRKGFILDTINLPLSFTTKLSSSSNSICSPLIGFER